MIDIRKAKKAFKEYVKNYDKKNEMIKLKIVHTYKVVKISEYIAKDIGLNKEDIELAKLIALLHDIGRFEQIRIYNSFMDSKTVDHADLGVQILFEENLIRNFIEENEYDQLIYKAIKNHNKYEIEEGLSQRELLHSKIIRDADKTDIYRVALTSKLEDFCEVKKEQIENDTITQNIFDEFMDKHLIPIKDAKTSLDMYLAYPAFIFDYNFISGLKYVKKKRYITRMLNQINYKREDTKEKVKQIEKFSTKYIKEKCNVGLKVL